MSRPTKCRRVCHFPPSSGFFPIQKGEADTPVILTVDEYETIRLMDLEGLSQQECSQWMEVARTTVQRIYENARKKLALALVEGRPLRIGGGDYRLCDGQESCGHDECFKRTYHQQYEKKKGADTMRIAVAYENGQIFQHFGHTEQFKIYDAEGRAVRQSEIVDTNGRGHGALAGILHALNADVLICGGIGQGAKDALEAAGIKLYGGVSGSADEAVSSFLNGTLSFQPDVTCSHHSERHGEGHTCGEHGCGEHEHGTHGCGGHCQ